MGKKILMALCAILVLAGCSSGIGGDDQKKQIVHHNKEGKKQKKVEITPTVKTTDKYYRTVAGYKESPARGNITYGVDNRLDIDELETGLMRHSQDAFSPDDYVFQEGQHLSSGNIESWLKNQSRGKKETKHSDPEGLNPKLPKHYGKMSWKEKEAFHKKHPSYLSYVVEQDYLKGSEDDNLSLGGISIGISMNKNYSYQIEDSEGLQHSGKVSLDRDKTREEAKEDAEKILKRIRKNKELKDVPVFFALYQEEDAESIVPGHFFAKTKVKGGRSKLGGWDKIKESHAHFPSDEASDNHKSDADSFDKFKSDVQEYFPNFVGVIGKGFYKDDHLQKLNIKIPIKFYSKTEIISFAQYISGLVDQNHFPFPKEIPVEVSITSTKGPEALVVRKEDMDEPYVHVYDH